MASAAQAHTSLASFHLRICVSLQPCNMATPEASTSRPEPDDVLDDSPSADAAACMVRAFADTVMPLPVKSFTVSPFNRMLLLPRLIPFWMLAADTSIASVTPLLKPLDSTRMPSAIARSVSALSITAPASKPLLLAELACCTNIPCAVPAVVDGVPIMLRTLTVPARSWVTAMFSVPARVKSTSVLNVTKPSCVVAPSTDSVPSKNALPFTPSWSSTYRSLPENVKPA